MKIRHWINDTVNYLQCSHFRVQSKSKQQIETRAKSKVHRWSDLQLRLGHFSALLYIQRRERVPDGLQQLALQIHNATTDTSCSHSETDTALNCGTETQAVVKKHCELPRQAVFWATQARATICALNAFQAEPYRSFEEDQKRVYDAQNAVQIGSSLDFKTHPEQATE